MANKYLKALQRQLKQRIKEPEPVIRKDGLRNFLTCLDPGVFVLKRCEVCGFGERCEFDGKADYRRFRGIVKGV